FAARLDVLAAAMAAAPVAVARSRPTPGALLELHTLQALDATLAGASLREVAQGLFGVDAVVADWHADSALRARVRRLVRRGDALMRGGYRRLAQLAPLPLD
ncbi:DNA -binding domain-containing protein, partial [Pseudomonas aeruginosa]